jgi:hypothetical protein
MKLYVKKVWSYNPTKYKYITLEKAQEDYLKYTILYFGGGHKSEYYKDFEKWLKTEI